MKHKHKLIIFVVSIIIVIIGIICLYWGELNQTDNNNQLKDSYSQFGQDIDIIEYLNNKTGGYFVDIGATDGINISNTYLLEEGYNWNGICIEPQENYYKQLIKNRSCHTDNSLLFSETGKLVDFSETNNGLAGITSHIDKHTDAKRAKQIKKKTDTLTNILIKYNAPTTIDYMSLDTEGSELEILKGIDFDTYKFGIMTIEHNHVEPRRSDIKKFLEDKGYKIYKEKGVDDYYILFK